MLGGKERSSAAARPLKQRALRGVGWAALGGNGAQLLAFVMFVAISRIVGPEAFGVVATSLLLVELARALTSESVAVNLVATGRFDRGEFDAGFALSVGLGALASLALALAAPLAAIVFGMPALETVLPQMAPLVALHAFARLFEAELTIDMQFRALAVRSVGSVAFGGAVGVASAYAGYGVFALVLQQWTALLAALVLLAAQAHWRPGFSQTRATMVRVARQSAVMTPAGVITNLRQSVDGFVVASLSGAAAAGIYNLAKRTRLALQLGLTAAVGRVSLPAFGKLKGEPARLTAAWRQSLRLTAVVAFPLFIGVAAVAPEIIELFLGAQWREAALPMAILMIGGAIAIITRLCENTLLVEGRRATIVLVHGFSLAALVALLALFGRFGLAAVASCVVAVGIAQNLTAWSLTVRLLQGARVKHYFLEVWVPMAVSVGMLVLVWSLREVGDWGAAPTALRLLAFMAIGAAFYVTGVWLFARASVAAAIQAARLAIAPAAGRAAETPG